MNFSCLYSTRRVCDTPWSGVLLLATVIVIFVCVSVYMYVCVVVCVRACVQCSYCQRETSVLCCTTRLVCSKQRPHAHKYTRTWSCIHVLTPTHTHTPTNASAHTPTHVSTHTPTHTYTRTWSCIHILIHRRTPTHPHTHTYARPYACLVRPNYGRFTACQTRGHP